MQTVIERLTRRLARRPIGRRLGQATVEFVLVSLVMIPTILGGIEIGRGVWYYNQIGLLAREGARWLIVLGVGDDPAAEMALTGNTAGTYNLDACGCGPNTAVGWMAQESLGLQRDRVTVDLTVPPAGQDIYSGLPAKVRVRYAYQPIVANYLGIPVTIDMEANSTMQMQ